ncbi:unnamed protein product [Cyclocybe aegerita]|uniref:SHSP domain-containing protein n=1 Tax=Cyclocybe aegerita TaxID=1973307 RepID=A0A8S0XRA6_CYCAE|nr:unnamed protein product [Cyclocybe aegerita]
MSYPYGGGGQYTDPQQGQSSSQHPSPHPSQPQQQEFNPPGAFPVPSWETLEHAHQQAHELSASASTHSPLEHDSATPVPTPTSTSFQFEHLEQHMEMDVEHAHEHDPMQEQELEYEHEQLDDPPRVVPSHVSPIDNSPIVLRPPHELPHNLPGQQHLRPAAHPHQSQYTHQHQPYYQHQHQHQQRPGSSSSSGLPPLPFRPPSAAPSHASASSGASGASSRTSLPSSRPSSSRPSSSRPATATGVIRTSTSTTSTSRGGRSAVQSTHPYLRPAYLGIGGSPDALGVGSGMGVGMGAGMGGGSMGMGSGMGGGMSMGSGMGMSMGGVGAGTGAKAKKPSVRFSSATVAPGAHMVPRKTSAGSGGMPSPAVPSPSSTMKGILYGSGSAASSPQTPVYPRASASASPQELLAHAHSLSHTPTPVPHQPPPPPLFAPRPTTSTFAAPSHLSYLPPQTLTQPHPQTRRRGTSTIPSDMHYSDTDNTLTASLELPGVTPDNLRVTLGTCYFNHVRFVSVAAESRPPFGVPEWGEEVAGKGSRSGVVQEGGVSEGPGEGDEGGEPRDGPEGEASTPTPTPTTQPQASTQAQQQAQPSQPPPEKLHVKVGKVNPDVRERRFGLLRRMIQVPSYTTMEDIRAHLKDGVLTLRIYCGKPYELDDEQDVPVLLG